MSDTPRKYAQRTREEWFERWEAWTANDYIAEEEQMAMRDCFAHIEELERENADLRHDIERHVKIAADQATEMEDLRAKLADQRAAMMDLSTVKVAPDAEWLRGFAAQCIAAIDAAIAQKEGK